MAKNTGLRVLGLTAVGLFLINYFRRIQPADLQVKILSFDIQIPKIFVNVQIFNPTRATVYMDSIAGNVFFNGQQIGVIQYVSHFPIQALGYTNLKILIDVSPAGLITLGTDILLRNAKSGVFVIAGNVYIGGVGVPFNQTARAW